MLPGDLSVVVPGSFHIPVKELHGLFIEGKVGRILRRPLQAFGRGIFQAPDGIVRAGLPYFRSQDREEVPALGIPGPPEVHCQLPQPGYGLGQGGMGGKGVQIGLLEGNGRKEGRIKIACAFLDLKPGFHGLGNGHVVGLQIVAEKMRPVAFAGGFAGSGTQPALFLLGHPGKVRNFLLQGVCHFGRGLLAPGQNCHARLFPA